MLNIPRRIFSAGRVKPPQPLHRNGHPAKVCCVTFASSLSRPARKSDGRANCSKRTMIWALQILSASGFGMRCSTRMATGLACCFSRRHPAACATGINGSQLVLDAGADYLLTIKETLRRSKSASSRNCPIRAPEVPNPAYPSQIQHDPLVHRRWEPIGLSQSDLPRGGMPPILQR